MTNNLKCVHCIEEYVHLSELEKSDIQSNGEFDTRVRDAVTLIPSWQTQMAGPNQMVMACITVPVCLDHIKVQKPSPEQIAQRNGLFLPGQN